MTKVSNIASLILKRTQPRTFRGAGLFAKAGLWVGRFRPLALVFLSRQWAVVEQHNHLHSTSIQAGDVIRQTILYQTLSNRAGLGGEAVKKIPLSPPFAKGEAGQPYVGIAGHDLLSPSLVKRGCRQTEMPRRKSPSIPLFQSGRPDSTLKNQMDTLSYPPPLQKGEAPRSSDWAGRGEDFVLRFATTSKMEGRGGFASRLYQTLINKHFPTNRRVGGAGAIPTTTPAAHEGYAGHEWQYLHPAEGMGGQRLTGLLRQRNPSLSTRLYQTLVNQHFPANRRVAGADAIPTPLPHTITKAGDNRTYQTNSTKHDPASPFAKGGWRGIFFTTWQFGNTIIQKRVDRARGEGSKKEEGWGLEGEKIRSGEIATRFARFTAPTPLKTAAINSMTAGVMADAPDGIQPHPAPMPPLALTLSLPTSGLPTTDTALTSPVAQTTNLPPPANLYYQHPETAGADSPTNRQATAGHPPAPAKPAGNTTHYHSHGSKPPVFPAATMQPPGMSNPAAPFPIDLDRLAETVMQKIDKQIRIERQRRGLL